MQRLFPNSEGAGCAIVCFASCKSHRIQTQDSSFAATLLMLKMQRNAKWVRECPTAEQHPSPKDESTCPMNEARRMFCFDKTKTACQNRYWVASIQRGTKSTFSHNFHIGVCNVECSKMRVTHHFCFSFREDSLSRIEKK